MTILTVIAILDQEIQTADIIYAHLVSDSYSHNPN